MKRLLQFIILAPVAVISVAFAVANRHEVPVSLDPFAPEKALQTAPLFILLILALMCGVVIGGTFTWFAQGRHRRALREARGDAARWRGQAERAQPATASSTGAYSSGAYSPGAYSPGAYSSGAYSSGAYSTAQKEPAATTSRKLLAHSQIK